MPMAPAASESAIARVLPRGARKHRLLTATLLLWKCSPKNLPTQILIDHHPRLRRRLEARLGGLGLDKPPLAAFKANGGQHPGAVRTRVQTDPVVANVDLLGDGVAMDDDEAMVVAVLEERFANPAQVGLALIGERNAGPDAGVDEQIGANPEGIDEAQEEAAVVGGYLLPQDRHRAGRVHLFER